MIRVAVVLAFLALQLYVYRFFATEEVHPERKHFASFPMELGEWSCAKQESMTDDVLANLGVTDYLICDYGRGPAKNERVGVYVGYHQSQVRKEGGGAGGGQIHPPSHCLPGSGWDIIASEKVRIELPGLAEGGALVNRLVIAKGDARQLVYYWYQERGRVIADDWMKIVWLFWDRARLQRTDGSLVRFTIPMGRDDDESAERAFREIAPLVTSQLPAFSPS
jgi:EpsI family protein